MPDKFDNSENEKYWEERSVEYEKAWHKRCQENLESELAQYYEQALKDIQDDVAALYGRFAKDNKLSMAEAHKLLTGSEYRRWRMSMEEYLQGIEEFDQKGLSRELDTLAMRSRISRLDALYAETLKSLDALGRKTYDSMEDFLSKAYKDRFYHGMYDVAEMTGTMKADVAVDDDTVAKVVGTPWSGKNYSERIWKNNAQLGNIIRTTIENGVHRGLSVPDMSRMVEEKMHAGRYNATRLVRTEMNYVQNRAALDSIKESGLKYFRFIATLDRRTSAQCREHDGRLIPLEEARTGDNVPPLHPNCRSTIAGSLRGYAKPGNTRIARNAAGKNVYVPQGMTYNQWKAVYVDKSITLEDWRLKEWRKPNGSSATASPLKSIQNARSTEELSDVMFGALKPYGIKKVDLNGSNLDIMRDQMAAWLNLTKEYKTGTVEIRIESSKSAQAKVIRVGESREAILELTKSYYNTDKERFIRWEAQDSVSTEFSLPQNPVIPADRLIIRTITHEFAHSISQSQLDPVFWKEIKAIRRRYKTALSKIDKRRIVLKEIDFEQAIKEKKKIFISEYADTNADEFFAEAFCAVKLNPDASPFAKEVLKVTDKYFKRTEAVRNINTQQNYKSVIVDSLSTEKENYHGIDLTYKKLLGVSSNLYLSDTVHLKPLMQHNIDMRIRKALKVLGASSDDDIPKFIIVSDTEMSDGALAAFLPFKNEVLLRTSIGNRKNGMAELQKDGVCADSEISAIVHELIHWQDAQKWIKRNGALPPDYIEKLRKVCKKKLDEIPKDKYIYVSTYAYKCGLRSKWDEVYTEYRVNKILRK